MDTPSDTDSWIFETPEKEQLGDIHSQSSPDWLFSTGTPTPHVELHVTATCTEDTQATDDTHVESHDNTDHSDASSVTCAPSTSGCIKGRKRIADKFDDIVESATTYLEQNSFAADGRRRTTTAQSCGVSIPQVNKHLLEKYKSEGLDDISTSTIRRWMQPPNI